MLSCMRTPGDHPHAILEAVSHELTLPEMPLTAYVGPFCAEPNQDCASWSVHPTPLEGGGDVESGWVGNGGTSTPRPPWEWDFVGLCAQVMTFFKNMALIVCDHSLYKSYPPPPPLPQGWVGASSGGWMGWQCPSPTTIPAPKAKHEADPKEG